MYILDIIHNKIYNIDSKDRKARSLTNEGSGRSEGSRIVSGFLTPPGISGTGIPAFLPSHQSEELVMNANKLMSLLLIAAAMFLNGCAVHGHRPAGYVYDSIGVPHGYLIPTGRTAEDQLRWVDLEEQRYCSRNARMADTIVGVVIGATSGAVIAGRAARAPGAVIGGLGGGTVSSVGVGQYCGMLQTTRGLITQKIEDYSAKSICQHRQGERNGRRYTSTDCASTTGNIEGYKAYPNR